MAHLSGFGLENFRVFKEYTWFDFAPITILVGPNNSGKSSLIKALMLIKENKDTFFTGYLSFDRGEHNLLNGESLICHRNLAQEVVDNKVTFHLPTSRDNQFSLSSFKLIYDTQGNSSAIEGFDLFGNKIFASQSFVFAQALIDENDESLFKQCFNYLNTLSFLPVSRGGFPRTVSKDDKNVSNRLLTEAEYLNSTSSLFEKKWLKEFNLSDKINIIEHKSAKILQVEVGGRSVADMGSGISQILFMLLLIRNNHPLTDEEKYEVKRKGGQILILEEPEANLHPAFQSKLGSLFLDTYKVYKNQFIIETHSEYLIRKLQYLTAKGEIKPEDTVIYYFHDPNNIPPGEKQVKKITILEDGSLSDDFGPGFYDVAAHWKFELLRLKNARKN